ncbi:MAG: DUF4296 domain-containing protein [Paludibacteraceae bacterium]|nr:DUF4296 domain-containing protein [Paludibacteraceae bacterium]
MKTSQPVHKRIIHYSLFIILCAAVFTACRPRNILSPKQMEDVFVDLHTAEGMIEISGLNYGHDEYLKGYFQSVLDKHGITQAQFDSSLVWYTSNPVIFEKIYPKVVERLEKQAEDAKNAEQAAKEAEQAAKMQKE